MNVADQVVEAVQTGAIKQFFVMAGCDGRMKSRNYYTDFASELPGILLFLPQAVRSTNITSLISVRLAVFRVCWTPASAMTPIPWSLLPSS